MQRVSRPGAAGRASTLFDAQRDIEARSSTMRQLFDAQRDLEARASTLIDAQRDIEARSSAMRQLFAAQRILKRDRQRQRRSSDVGLQLECPNERRTATDSERHPTDEGVHEATVCSRGLRAPPAMRAALSFKKTRAHRMRPGPLNAG